MMLNPDGQADGILVFSGRFRFLSNFYPAKVTYDRVVYPSVEHAYQAAKTLRAASRLLIKNAPTPGEAKRLGRQVPLRANWDSMRLAVMLDLLRKKFKHPELRDLLLETGALHLEEGNTWGDTFWGTVHDRGHNHLGKLLMRVRDDVARANKKEKTVVELTLTRETIENAGPPGIAVSVLPMRRSGG
jgi:ribA/ribD-fused uncharacterized protein